MASSVQDRIAGVIGDFAYKAPCRVVATTPITTSGTQTIDGVALAVLDRVLVTGQADTTLNGIYTVDTGAWELAPDFLSSQSVARGSQIFITDGAANAGTSWSTVATNPVNPQTPSNPSAITFQRVVVAPVTSAILWGGTSAGTATVQTVSTVPNPGAWAAGQVYIWKSGFNAGAGLTLNANGQGAKTVLRPDGSAVASGDFATGNNLEAVYDGTNLTLTSPVATTNLVAGPGTAVTDHSLALWNGTGGKTVKNGPAIGTAGQPLMSNGAGADPSFQNVSMIQTKTADYTLVLGDQGDTFIMNSASPHTFTLPDDLTVGNGWFVRIINRGAGICTIARAGTDTIASGGSTSLTSIALSQGDAGDITADGVSHGIFWWTGVRHYDSGSQTITSAGALTLAHGLGVQPTSVDLWLQNVSTEAGYTAGQQIPTSPAQMNTTPNTEGASYIVDATNITVRFASAANIFSLPNATTGSPTNLTNAKWGCIWRARVFN